MQNGNLHELAKQAKLRMKETQKNKASRTELLRRTYADTYEEIAYEKVVKMMESNEIIINPIGRLLDNSYYRNCSEELKGKIVLDTAKLYQKLVKRYHETKARQKENLSVWLVISAIKTIYNEIRQGSFSPCLLS